MVEGKGGPGPVVLDLNTKVLGEEAESSFTMQVLTRPLSETEPKSLKLVSSIYLKQNSNPVAL